MRVNINMHTLILYVTANFTVTAHVHTYTAMKRKSSSVVAN